MSKYRIVVEAVVEVDDELANCPDNGIYAIAQAFAAMAVNYGSICAESASVMQIEKSTPDLNREP